MKVAGAELIERARQTAPDAVAVVDAIGRTPLRPGRRGAPPSSPTRWATAWTEPPRSWSRPTTPGAPWPRRSPSVMRGGLIAVISGHADPLGVRAGPGGHRARRRARRTRDARDLAGGPRRFADAGEVLAGWPLRLAAPGDHLGSGALERRRRDRDDVRLHRTSQVRGPVRVRDPLRRSRPRSTRSACAPVTRSARWCRCRRWRPSASGMYLPAMLGGPRSAWTKWNAAAARRSCCERHRSRGRCWSRRWRSSCRWCPAPRVRCVAMTAMTVGGGPMNADALWAAPSSILGTKFLRVFGMSECLGHTTPLPSDDADVRLGRDGRPFPGTEIRVVDPEGRALPAGEVGNAQVRGPSLFVGYARGGARSRPSSPRTASCPPGTTPASTRTAPSTSWAARSRSSSAAGATSTSTRWRQQWPPFRESPRCASCRCPTTCWGSVRRRSSCSPATR